MKTTLSIMIGLLCLAQSSPATTYEGIYSGTFWGVSGGEFVSIVEADNSMTIWSYDATWDEGNRDTLTVTSNGLFSGMVGDTLISGSIVGTFVSGSGTNMYGTIYFGGNRKPDSGITNHFVGYYEGIADSNLDTYSCNCILAADGTAWFYTVGGVYGENGGRGTINSDGSFHVVDVDGVSFTGTVDEGSFSILNGAFSGGGEVGTLALHRVISFANLPSVNQYKPRVTLTTSGTLQLRMMTHERRSYTVRRSTNLKTWTPRQTFRGTGSEMTYTENPPAGRVFYCVEIDE